MLPEEISKVPSKPGVYTFKDNRDRVLYIGKAKNLKARVRSYFQRKATLDSRKTSMVKLVFDVSYIVTENELEALVLEAALIKQYKPRFNIVLRDDKNYPYLRLTINEEWPRLEVVRRIMRDHSVYFGPYVPARGMWDTLSFIRRNFPIRTCSHNIDRPSRPCIQYEISRCPAPCGRKISRDDYMKIVGEVRLFLGGESKELLRNLESKMALLSNDLKFEEAAKIRDRIINIRNAWESQRVVAPEIGDMDVIGFFSDSLDGLFEVFFIRGGILIGTKDFFIKDVKDLQKKEILRSFIELFYSKEIIPPERIIVRNRPDDIVNLRAWLKDRKGRTVKIEVPGQGKELELLEMAEDNAAQLFDDKKVNSERVLRVLQERLNLPRLPRTIGAFDVSTMAGSESVGAFVCWSDGEFRKESYRHIRIKEVSGIDDYSMMKEVVTRTLDNLGIKIPDLLLIDGGKGQLEIARNVIRAKNIVGESVEEPMLIGVAKDPDRAVTPSSNIVNLEDGSPSSLLVKRIRDEAHRFAINYHRNLRGKRLMQSSLEEIPGIGKKRRFELLRFFGSIDAVRRASVDEIAKLRGFDKKLAEKLLSGLRRQ